MQFKAPIWVLSISAFCLLALVPSSGNASCFDFQNKSLDGWTQSNSGGTATFDVVEKNGSSRAHVRHVSNTSSGDQSSLSRTFNYAPNDVIRFEMEALAFVSGSRQGLAGVQVSFLNSFNVPLGSAGLFHVTSSSLLGPNDSAISSPQEDYSATMAEFAALAGLGDGDPIAKVSVSFLARGFFAFGGNIYPNDRSGGDVWFDNVCVDTGSQSSAKFAIELPGDQVSGINGVGGWKCPQNGDITIIFDSQPPLPAAGHLRRSDTAEVCGNSGENGFLAEVNYALHGDGTHTVRFLDGGVEFAAKTFSIGTLGSGFVPFARGLAGEYELFDFPQTGLKTIVEWKEELQGFVILRTQSR